MKGLSKCQKMQSLKQLNDQVTDAKSLQAGWGKKNPVREEAVYSYTFNFHCNLKVPNSVVRDFLWNKCYSVQSQTSTGCRDDKRVKWCFIKKLIPGKYCSI